MSGKIALIAGVAGQNSAYLAEFLLNRNYTVHAVKRRAPSPAVSRTDRHDLDRPLESGRYFLQYGDLTDAGNLMRIVQEVQPDEIYNLGAESRLQVSGEGPEYTAEVDALGTLRLLEAIRTLHLQDRLRFYHSSTSELFGHAGEVPRSETTPFCPTSPFAAAKLYAWWLTRTYREEYGLHASNGILFGHEGPLRGEALVTRKITRAVAAIERGIQERLYLGNIDARREWGHARDYAAGMWMILQQKRPDDYVLATGETHTVREFVELAFACIGRPVVWEGAGLAEVARCLRSGDIVVSVDPRHFRPGDEDHPEGDACKAHAKLGWRPRIGFEQLVTELVDADRLALEREMFENG